MQARRSRVRSSRMQSGCMRRGAGRERLCGDLILPTDTVTNQDLGMYNVQCINIRAVLNLIHWAVLTNCDGGSQGPKQRSRHCTGDFVAVFSSNRWINHEHTQKLHSYLSCPGQQKDNDNKKDNEVVNHCFIFMDIVGQWFDGGPFFYKKIDFTNVDGGCHHFMKVFFTKKMLFS